MPGRNTGTGTIFFIFKGEIPNERWKDVSYIRIVCNECPQKEEINWTRLTFGGRNLQIDMDCGTPTEILLTIKLLINSIISTPGENFLWLDLKEFYLNTPMDWPEFLCIKLNNFLEDVIENYKLRENVDKKGFVYVKCVRGMYGLPHALIMAQKLLKERLEKHGYHQSDKTPGFCKNDKRPISFTLIVDDFGVKYVDNKHAKHLINVLKKHFTVAEDWEGEKYCGITIDWDYTKRQVHFSMPEYVKYSLTQIQHTLQTLTDQPHKHTIPVFGVTIQYAKAEDTSNKFDDDGKKIIQQVTGTFLYYDQTVESIMLVALSKIASIQAAPTEATTDKAKYFLDYTASRPDAILSYSASNMVLAAHSDAS